LTSSNPLYTAISKKVVPEQSGKVKYECEKLLGIAKKLMIFQRLPAAFHAHICSGTTLIEITAYLMQISIP
jgi:hypothetical protein